MCLTLLVFLSHRNGKQMYAYLSSSVANDDHFLLVLPSLKIGLLGAGRMSQALARSLVENKIVASKDQILASDVDANQRKLVTVCYLSNRSHSSLSLVAVFLVSTRYCHQRGQSTDSQGEWSADISGQAEGCPTRFERDSWTIAGESSFTDIDCSGNSNHHDRTGQSNHVSSEEKRSILEWYLALETEVSSGAGHAQCRLLSQCQL